MLSSNSSEELQVMISKLNEANSTVNTKFNERKTMINVSHLQIIVNRTPIGVIKEYAYLGQNLSFHQGNEREIKRRFKFSVKKFWTLSNIF